MTLYGRTSKHKRSTITIYLLAFLLMAAVAGASGQASAFPQSALPVLVDVQENLDRLIKEEDTDGD